MLILKGGDLMDLDFANEIDRLTKIADQSGDDNGAQTQRLEDLLDFEDAVEELTGEQQQADDLAL